MKAIQTWIPRVEEWLIFHGAGMTAVPGLRLL
jgi:hypothetical protein